MLSAHRQREDHNDLHRWHNNNFLFHSSKRKKRFKAKREAFQEKAFQIHRFNRSVQERGIRALLLSPDPEVLRSAKQPRRNKSDFETPFPETLFCTLVKVMRSRRCLSDIKPAYAHRFHGNNVFHVLQNAFN